MSFNDDQVKRSPSFGLRIVVSAMLISISEITSLPARAENALFQGFSYRINESVEKVTFAKALSTIYRF
jgi:hypothetical protein